MTSPSIAMNNEPERAAAAEEAPQQQQQEQQQQQQPSRRRDELKLRIRHCLLHLLHAAKSYLALHIAAFLAISLLGGMVISLVQDLHYIDGLFTATSAICVTGLSVKEVARLNLAAQLTILCLTIMGSTTLVSVAPMLIRRFIIRRKHRDLSAESMLELRAMARLSIIIVGYMFVNILVVFLAAGFYTQFTDAVDATMQANGVGPWYSSIFIAVAAFSNAGFTPYSNSLIGYARNPFLLLLYSYLILAGNTAFPIFLRISLFIRHALRQFFKDDNQIYEYTLKHPRRIYTHLFPTKVTLSLAAILVVITTFQWANTLGFDWSSNLGHLSTGNKILNSFFQSISTRTAGFNSVVLISESAPVQVLQIVMMYISTLPVALSIRTSNEEAWNPQENLPVQPIPRFGSLLRRTLQRDLILLATAFYLISAFERNRVMDPTTEQPILLFQILYEIVSAYGTVGLSLSPLSVSLSGVLRPASRLVIVVIMLAGRHRGLGLLVPFKVDSALPPTRPRDAHALS